MSKKPNKRKAEKGVEVAEVVESKESAGVAVAHCAMQLLRVFICVVLVGSIAAVIAVSVIPAIGTTLLYQMGIDGSSSVATILSMWLIPELFCTALMGVALVRFAQWFWGKSGIMVTTMYEKMLARSKTKESNDD